MVFSKGKECDTHKDLAKRNDKYSVEGESDA